MGTVGAVLGCLHGLPAWLRTHYALGSTIDAGATAAEFLLRPAQPAAGGHRDLLQSGQTKKDVGALGIPACHRARADAGRDRNRTRHRGPAETRRLRERAELLPGLLTTRPTELLST